MISKIFSPHAQALSVFIIAFLITSIGIRIAAAHEYPYRYYSSTAKLKDSGTNYGAYIRDAAFAYDSTDLTVSSVTSGGGFGYITYVQGNYGASGWIAKAIGYNQYNEPCFDASLQWTGKCNSSDRKVHYGTISLDLQNKEFIDNNTRYIMRHEAGHIFGMTHGPCSEVSVMVPTSCSTLYGGLQTHDKNFINANY